MVHKARSSAPSDAVLAIRVVPSRVVSFCRSFLCVACRVALCQWSVLLFSLCSFVAMILYVRMSVRAGVVDGEFRCFMLPFYTSKWSSIAPSTAVDARPRRRRSM